ncbi:hypothetical protein BJ508DRAFT_412806 [Ascobolus immersus RN42]|uniref:CUE domain-containing protein n=1 Tax=Ascobolus immersus RN42 TaxID=1160509 RepID=A0A3N4IE64_ASCIM|nr:hypothetical protein BJ508DRAFT_412806 [Ascobolus immersus RN42]
MHPRLPPYPSPTILSSLPAEEWSPIQDSYCETLDYYLRLPSASFSQHAIPDGDVLTYLTTYTTTLLSAPRPLPKLQRYTFLLLHRLLNTTAKPPPTELLRAEFLRDICRVYPKNSKLRELLSSVARKNPNLIDPELNRLVSESSKDITNDTEPTLHELIPLFRQFPYAAHMFVASSDFLDTLSDLYKSSKVSASGRNLILVAAHELFKSLLSEEAPNYSTFKDQVYMLLSTNKDLASDLLHKTTLLPELVAFSETESRAVSLVDHLVSKFPQAPTEIQTPAPKGKEKEQPHHESTPAEIGSGSAEHAVFDSLVTEIRSILPHISERTARSSLTKHNMDLEATLRQLLESPPPSPPPSPPVEPAPAPGPVPHIPKLPKEPKETGARFKPLPATAEVLIRQAPAPVIDTTLKDNILRLLAEDERDDTYDTADIGGLVSPGNSDDEEESTISEKLLLAAYASDISIFSRTADARKSKKRADLKRRLAETSGTQWSDEMIEGWGVMLQRGGNAQDKIKSAEMSNAGRAVQPQIQRTSYRRGPEDDEEGDEPRERAGVNRGRGGRVPRGPSRGGRGGGRGGAQGGQGGGDGGQGSSGGQREAPSARARARKEHNKGAVQRRGRAQKMARMGGGPPAE